MQSAENTLMIANLNAIARVDLSLNTLMKIVALGGATPQQIITFQGYIQRAREMGPPPHPPHLLHGTPPPPGYIRGQPYARVGAGFAPLKKPPKEKKPKPARELKLTAFQERYLNGATILFEFVENPNVRFALPREFISEVVSEPKPPRDLEDEQPTDVLLSFLWIHNRREYEAYVEKREAYDKAVREKEEKEREEREKEEREEKEKEEREKEKEEKETEEKGKEEVKAEVPVVVQADAASQPAAAAEPAEVKTEAPKPADAAADAAASAAAEPEERSLRNRRRRPAAPRRPAKKELAPPAEPEVRFTAVSFTLGAIPARYVPIVVNSSRPADVVRQQMSHVLSIGSRMPSYYLWYQVDGKLDEELAERLRVELNQEEKKMTGIVSAAISSETMERKRRLKEEKEERQRLKRLRKAEQASLLPAPAPAPTAVKLEQPSAAAMGLAPRGEGGPSASENPS